MVALRSQGNWRWEGPLAFPYWVFGWFLVSYVEAEMTTHSSLLAWRIPSTEEPGGLQSMGSQTVGHD